LSQINTSYNFIQNVGVTAQFLLKQLQFNKRPTDNSQLIHSLAVNLAISVSEAAAAFEAGTAIQATSIGNDAC
jgi:hypothetical protein